MIDSLILYIQFPTDRCVYYNIVRGQADHRGDREILYREEHNYGVVAQVSMIEVTRKTENPR